MEFTKHVGEYKGEEYLKIKADGIRIWWPVSEENNADQPEKIMSEIKRNREGFAKRLVLLSGEYGDYYLVSSEEVTVL